AQSLRLRLGAGPGRLGKTDAHVHPGVAQREGVGVPLAAVTDDRDRTVLDQAQFSGVVVVHRGHVKCFSLGVGAAHFWGGLERSLRILGEVWYVWRQTLGRFGTPSPKP